MRDSLCHPPIDTRSGDVIWLYRVHENRRAADAVGGLSGPRSCIVFATGHLPFLGEAQYDLGHYKYANYA